MNQKPLEQSKSFTIFQISQERRLGAAVETEKFSFRVFRLIKWTEGNNNKFRARKIESLKDGKTKFGANFHENSSENVANCAFSANVKWIEVTLASKWQIQWRTRKKALKSWVFTRSCRDFYWQRKIETSWQRSESLLWNDWVGKQPPNPFPTLQAELWNNKSVNLIFN